MSEQHFTTEERFWAKVNKATDDGCWLWTGARFRNGYGAFHPTKKPPHWLAHRYSWTLANGPIPPGLCVLHRCDVRSCVNSAHLFLGTLSDNSRDMTEKGRNGAHTHPELLARGERHSSRTHPERLARGARNGAHTRPERVRRGDQHGMAKLSTPQVLEIRALYATGSITQPALATRFGASLGSISNIVRRKTWREV